MTHRMMLRHATFAIALAACVAGQRSATAQTNSLFGSRGPVSPSRGGVDFSGGGQSFFGLSQQPNVVSGQFQSPTGGNIVGLGDNAGGFVGDQRVEQLRQGGNSRDFGNRSRGGDRNANGRSGADRAGRNSQRARAAIRPRQRVAFSYPVRGAAVVNVELTRQLYEIAKVRTELAGVAVMIDDSGLATITGMVDTPEQRRLAELLVRLEPGVRSVRNEMTVDGD
jgi:hypothetical protein